MQTSKSLTMGRRKNNFLGWFDYFCCVVGFVGILPNIVAIIYRFSKHHKNIDNIGFGVDENTLIGRVAWLIPIIILVLFVVVIKNIVKKYLLKYIYKSGYITGKEYDNLKKSSMDGALYVCIWFAISITYSLALLIFGVRTNYVEISCVLLPSCLLMVGTYFGRF